MSDCCTPDSGFCWPCVILVAALAPGPLLLVGMIARTVFHV
jgi:hypothetical protein